MTLFDHFYEESGTDRTGVGLHSISQLLMHSDVKKVYQFLQVLTGQVRSAEWLGAAVIDEGVAEANELQTLQHHFDGIVQTRESEAGHREFKIRGFGPESSTWQPF